MSKVIFLLMMLMVPVMATPQTSDADLRIAQLPALSVTGHEVNCQGLRVVISGSNDLVDATNAASVDFSGLTDLNYGYYNPSVTVSGLPILNGNADSLFHAITTYTGSLITINASGCGITSAASLTVPATNAYLNFSGNQIPSLDLSSGAITLGYGTMFDFANNPTLTTIVPGDGTSTGIIGWNANAVTFQGCALTQASEDALLNACVAAETAVPGQNGGLDLSGGTNAVPDSTGASDIALLVGAGWSITTN